MNNETVSNKNYERFVLIIILVIFSIIIMGSALLLNKNSYSSEELKEIYNKYYYKGTKIICLDKKNVKIMNKKTFDMYIFNKIQKIVFVNKKDNNVTLNFSNKDFYENCLLKDKTF